MDIGTIKADDLRTLKVARDMGLVDLTDAQVLEKFETPIKFRSCARAGGHKCTFRQAELIMSAVGWERPPEWAASTELPIRSRRKDWYEMGEDVPLSKYFTAPAGARVTRTYKNVKYTAKVTQNGKLLAEDFDGEIVSPTRWARLVMKKPPRAAIMPQVFWPKVKCIDPDLEELELQVTSDA